MASTLTYGFIKPQTGDGGAVFWPALEDDIQQLNDHTHNGTDSALLTAASSAGVTQDIAAAGWAGPDNGYYAQTVTLPAALTAGGATYDNYAIEIRNPANGNRLFLQTRKNTTNTFYVYSNDNSLDLRILYT